MLSPACLTVLVGRRLRPQTCAVLSELLALVVTQQVPLLVLFPGPGELIGRPACLQDNGLHAMQTGTACNRSCTCQCWPPAML